METSLDKQRLEDIKFYLNEKFARSVDLEQLCSNFKNPISSKTSVVGKILHRTLSPSDKSHLFDVIEECMLVACSELTEDLTDVIEMQRIQIQDLTVRLENVSNVLFDEEEL